MAPRSSGSVRRAGEGIRTPDLLITNQLLYQLSYASRNARAPSSSRNSAKRSPGSKKVRRKAQGCLALHLAKYPLVMANAVPMGLDVPAAAKRQDVMDERSACQHVFWLFPCAAPSIRFRPWGLRGHGQNPAKAAWFPASSSNRRQFPSCGVPHSSHRRRVPAYGLHSSQRPCWWQSASNSERSSPASNVVR